MRIQCRTLMMINLGVALLGCSDKEQNEEEPNIDTGDIFDTGEGYDTGLEDTDTQDTDTGEDTSPPPLVLEEGTWSVGTPTLLTDDCQLQNYQNVNGFVPTELMIERSTDTEFWLDANTQCSLNSDGSFQCDSQNIEEQVLTFTFSIQNTLSGHADSATSFQADFEVIVESCSGIGCGGLELFLSFPCLLELQSDVSKQ